MDPKKLTLKFHTTAITVADMDRAAAYYEKTFGLAGIYRDPVSRIAALKQGENGTQRLGLYELPTNAENTHNDIPSTFPVWLSDDIESDHEILRHLGVNVQPIKNHNGMQTFRIIDPDGNISVAIQFLPE